MLFSICLHIKSDNKSLINFYTYTLIRFLQNYPIKISSPIAFPIKITKYTVLRSPHIYKKSREQFEYRTFSYLITISFDRSFALYKHLFFILTFIKYQLPAGLALKFTNNIQF